MLDLDWQQKLFRAAWGLLRSARAAWRRGEGKPGAQATEVGEARAARLHDHVTSLTAFARVLAGLPVRLVAEGEDPRAGNTHGDGPALFLPAVVDLLPSRQDNRDVYLIRIAVFAAATQLARTSAEPDRDAALQWLAEELPGFSDRLEALRGRIPESLLLGPSHAAPGDRRSERSIEVAPARGERPPESPSAEAKAPRIGEVEWTELEERPQGDILLNPFERIETLDNWRGGSRNQDGADDLEAHLEALSEVELDRVTRGGRPARSLLRANVALDVESGHAADEQRTATGIPYDEWDYRLGRYRRDWCTVHPRRFEASDPAWVVETRARERVRIEQLTRRLERLRLGLLPESRQLDGDELDLAELVDEHAARRAGRSGDGRVYVRPARPSRALATTVLLDVSLSTDAWVAGRRVLDVAREAVFVLGEVSARMGDRLCVLGFASETRHRCLIWELLGWDEDWRTGAARLGAVSPRGYTRIGPALRHATRDLARLDADRKLLLLVSDAKPTDSDRYEGRHGLADVRQAIREATRCGIHAHALAIDSVAREWLPSLFGSGAWDALPRPERVPDVLVSTYGRLTAMPH